jgi:hypothetical protein
VFGPVGDTIPALQQRGVVFLACHNAIWEVTGNLIARGTNPHHVSHEAVVAELTNPPSKLNPGRPDLDGEQISDRDARRAVRH